jgi:hypothetical protein
MYRESELTFSDFVYNNRFELNSYISYIFHQFYDNVPNQSEDKMITPYVLID